MTPRARIAQRCLARGFWVVRATSSGLACLLWLASAVSAQQAPGPVPAAHANAQQCFERAQADYAAGRLAEARRGLHCAYAQMPASAELVWNLARVSERMGDVDEGLRYFREYLTLAQPTEAERKRIEAKIAALIRLGERQAVALKPGPDVSKALSNEARTFFDRGAKLYRGGHYQAAAAAFTAALQLSAAPELHYNLGVTAERLQQIEDACDHYRSYLEAWPEAPDRARVQAHISALRNQLAGLPD
jgi:tetratricopeptide (TPR) repeat protein